MSLLTLLRPEQRASHARVRTSACRGYVVELDPESEAGPRPLRDLTGDFVHFRSLERVRDALRRRGVGHAVLVQHHACEELSALGPSTRSERGAVVLGGRTP
ncbi:MAG: hypothetical protein V2J24_01290 [Pseudomonadales bacterium]|jgi:hypothetical protein|nr:hypothetical protein [Pseudomonadales bacterium]